MWARTQGTLTISPGGVIRSSALSAFQALYGAQLIGSTVVRTRGVIATQTSDATTGFNQLRFAMIVEPNPGSAPVVADGPVGGEHNDWLLYEPFIVAGAGQIGVNQDPAGRVIDVKAARKLDELGDELLIYAGTQASNTAAVTVSWDLSIGVKLP